MKLLIILFVIASNLFSAVYEKSVDTKNVYYVSEHFRAIFGITYENDNVTVSLANTYLEIAEATWSKEIDELGFKMPKNTNIKKIDMYLGNRLAYNYETNINETIGINYAGWAAEYPSDNTPFFVLNPNLEEDILKVTIAHEFFHTIQYSYFFGNILNENIWWLEATATLMEDEVYDSIDDYINYMNNFFNASHKSFELYDGSHEYAMVIFTKYIKEKYGLEIIKNSLIQMNETAQSISCFEILDSLLIKDYNSSMQISVNEFAKWVANSSAYFEEGDLYPPLKHFDANETAVIGKGGIKVVDNLKSGWNMVTLSHADFNSLDINHIESAWSYKDGVWSNSIAGQISSVESSQGYWIKTSAASSLYYTYFDNGENEISTLNDQWNLFGTTKELSMNYFDSQNIILWQYNNGVWLLYTNDSTLLEKVQKLGYNTLVTIPAYSSYWIKRI